MVRRCETCYELIQWDKQVRAWTGAWTGAPCTEGEHYPKRSRLEELLIDWYCVASMTGSRWSWNIKSLLGGANK